MMNNNHKNRTADTLPLHIVDEKNGLTYTLCGDYYLPDLGVPMKTTPIGRFGLMRMQYLEKHRPGLFTRLILSGKLDEHLAEIDAVAQQRFDTLMAGYKEMLLIDEQLKAQDQMKWVRMMNLARCEAEQIIMDEIVFD